MDYNALGRRIRECRIKHNYTQLQVAEQLLFSQKHIGNIERGDAKPSVDLLARPTAPISWPACPRAPS